jgi:hypothetical protein
MVTAASRPNHTHRFEIKGTRGTCKCGEIREYIYSSNPRDNTFKVIQAGDPNYQDEKRQIAVDHTDEIMAELAGSTAKPTENMPKNIPEKPQSEAKPEEATAKNAEMLVNKSLPPKPQGYIAIRKWIDENKDAILIDLAAIGERRTREKWGISSTALRNARIRWGIYKAKTQTATLSTEEADSVPEKAEAVTDTFEDPADALAFESAINIDITWDFLNSLGDEDFNRLWAAVGVIVQVQAKKRVEG